MTIALHHSKSPLDHLDAVAYGVAHWVFSGFKSITRLPILLAWAIGLVLAVTFGFIYTTIFYVPLVLVRKRMKHHVYTLLSQVHSLEDRDAMLLHADVEESRVRLERIARIGSTFFVFVPLTHEIRKSAATLHKLEVALFSRTYPDHRAPLSAEQARNLFEATKDWREDWEDKRMDVYND